jgi:hypothetical protein
MLKVRLCATVSTSALALTLSGANAAGPEFCHAYAQAAINQVRAALANPGCAGGVHGPR